MGRVDVTFTISIHGSLQCNEEDMESKLESFRAECKELVWEKAAVSDVVIDIASVAEAQPLGGD